MHEKSLKLQQYDVGKPVTQKMLSLLWLNQEGLQNMLWGCFASVLPNFTYFPVGLYIFCEVAANIRGQNVRMSWESQTAGLFSKDQSHFSALRRQKATFLPANIISAPLWLCGRFSMCFCGGKKSSGAQQSQMLLWKLWVRHTHPASLAVHPLVTVSTLAIITSGENSHADTPDNRRTINKGWHSVG